MPKPKALLLNCSLKRTPEKSRTGALLYSLRTHLLPKYSVAVVRVADRPEWFKHKGFGMDSKIVQAILAADVVVVGTPIWWGSHSSYAQWLIEMLDDQDDQNRDDEKNPFLGKRAAIVVTGKEDGTQHVVATLSSAMNWMGFAFAAQGNVTKTDSTPEKQVAEMLVRCARGLGA